VVLSATTTPYQLAHPLSIPTHVSLVGESPGTRLVAVGRMDAMIQVDAPLPLGNRLGTVANLAIDGNALADCGVLLKTCVQRSFERLSVTACRLSGVRIVGSQNNVFMGVDIEHNGRDVGEARHGGLELVAGADNNCFARCEFNQNGGYQALIAGKGALPWTNPQGPSGNTFLACIFERAEANTRAAIYAGDGRMNTWIRCDLSHEGPTMIEGPGDPGGTCHLWRFYACALSGSPTTTCVGRASRLWGMVFDACLFETFASVTDGTSAERVAVLQTNQVSNVTQWRAEAASLTPPLRLGDTYLWADPHGELRVRAGAPGGPYDGRRLTVEGGWR
jgi:hypothetical protein